jgi:type II secretory pathway pseudopilin PulG
MTSSFALSQVFLFLFGFGGLGLPLGMPPAPEDPLLANVAPEECLFYASWAGMAAPNPQSSNPTERLLAEPEVRQFVAEVDRQIRKAVGHAAEKEDPRARALIQDGSRWARVLLTHPAAVCVSQVKMGVKGPDVRAAAVVNLGEEAAEVRASLERQQKAFLGEAADTVQIEGSDWHRLKLDPAAPPIVWGLKGKYLFVGVGEGSIEDALKRARAGSPPNWLTAIGKQLPIPRRSTVSYINVKAIADLALPMAGQEAGAVVQALGLGNVTNVASVTGLDETGFVSKTLIGLDGDPAGLLGLVAEKPLTAADLRPIPRDATIGLAARIDAAGVLDAVQSIVAKIEPRAGEELSRELKRIADHMGIDLREDLLKPLGDVWCLYNAPSEGGLVITGLTLVVPVRDAERLAKTHARLLDQAQEALRRDDPRSRRGASIVQSEVAGRKMWHLLARDEDFPLAPAWCLTDKELIVALFPQNVKAYLTRGADYRSLAEAKGVADALEGENGPAKLAYQDTAALFEMVYPLLQIGAKYLVAEAAREGLELDLASLPSAASIRRHLRPGVTMVRRTPAGIEVSARQTLPGGSVGASAPLAIALLLPAVQSAREAARRSQSMNNLKQIALAMHNHHDAYRKLPAAYSVDKEGKPLLSWRVHILPFVESQALYRQFRLDEPWDSEHNKKLIERMPATYRSPNSRAEPGKTNYLAVRGKNMMFTGEKGTSFADIVDGLSNTAMVVEAGDRSAVIWTKPDDFEPSEENPTKGLLGLRPGGFNVALGDGSVRFLSQNIDPKVLWALFTRNGGEVIDYDALNRPARPRPMRPRETTPRKAEAPDARGE